MELSLSEDLCEFIGVLIGDGFIGTYGERRQVNMIQIVGHPRDDKDYLENYITPLMKKLFGKKPSAAVRQRALYITLYSKETLNFLAKKFSIPIGKKSYTIRIPESIMSNDTLAKATLRGIFDTDGTLFFDKRKIYKKPYPRISITTVSKDLSQQIAELFERFNFKFYVRTDNRKVRKGKPVYYLEIYGHEQINRWFNEIGSSNQKHLKKLLPR